ncbi:MAG TPA: hypothetical protein VGR56_02415 [Nitrososphaerales archaeon]|nr:hypothetical protein [Nitrososphaerales archaeon]
MQPADNPDEGEPKLARRSPFVLAIKLCPRCLSPLKEVNRALQGWVPMNYYCTKCGYSGSVFVEKEQESSAEPE